MKTLTAVALAAASCVAAFGSAATIAATQANNSITCRAALEDSRFHPISSDEENICCYVLQELDWYRAHNVRLHHSYLRDKDQRIYFTKECMTESGAALGDGDGNGGGGGGGGNSSSSQPPDSSSSSQPPESSEPPHPGDAIGNPGNGKPVGKAGEAPNGDVEGFKPSPGTKGKSNH
jgi:hypothetical protein